MQSQNEKLLLLLSALEKALHIRVLPNAPSLAKVLYLMSMHVQQELNIL